MFFRPATTMSRHKRRVDQRRRGRVSRRQDDCHAGRKNSVPYPPQCPLPSPHVEDFAIEKRPTTEGVGGWCSDGDRRSPKIA